MHPEALPTSLFQAFWLPRVSTHLSYPHHSAVFLKHKSCHCHLALWLPFLFPVGQFSQASACSQPFLAWPELGASDSPSVTQPRFLLSTGASRHADTRTSPPSASAMAHPGTCPAPCDVTDQKSPVLRNLQLILRHPPLPSLCSLRGSHLGIKAVEG